MKSSIRVDGLFIATVAAVGVGVWLYHKRDKIAEAVNITSSENLAYKGVNAVGEAVTGDDGWSLGSAIYEAIDPYDVYSAQTGAEQ